MDKKFLDKKILATLIITQAFGLSILAWGARDREPAAVTRMQARDIMATTSISGTLDCQHKESNTGEACTLKLTASDTGRIYELSGSHSAMRLYNDGVREVQVIGKTRGPFLVVNQIQAIGTLKQ